MTGKATFGFISNYKKGADEPFGTTEFRFRAAELNFKNDDYDCLVVSGDTAPMQRHRLAQEPERRLYV